MKLITITLLLLNIIYCKSNNINKEYIQNLLDYYTNLIKVDNNNINTCKYNKACNNNLIFEPNEQFNNLSINTNEIIFKMSLNENTTEEEICSITNQYDNWRYNLDNNNGIKWQYYGSNTGLTAFYPSVNWTEANECPGEYDPRLRPWYSTAISGQKNLIIMIDISSSQDNANERLNISKYIAKKLINSLSYRDFVIVMTYSDYPSFYENELIRATYENINELNLYIDELTLLNNGLSNIGLATRKVINLLKLSIEDNSSSRCRNTIVLLTSGYNELVNINPINELIINNEPIIQDLHLFSYIISPNNDDYHKYYPTKMSCSIGGFTEIIQNYDNIDLKIKKYNNYISNGIDNIVVRYSEPYDDALKQGRMITGALPIKNNYIDGVLAIDITIQNITNNNNISEDFLLDYLVENQQCEAFNYDNIEEDEKCNNINDGDFVKTPEFIKQKDWLITSSVFGPIILFFLIGIIVVEILYYLKKNKSPNNYTHKNNLYNTTYSYIFYVLFIYLVWVLPVFWDFYCYFVLYILI